MSAIAFGLVLVSACMHASWNVLAKRAGNSVGFVWLFSVLSAGFYLPITVFFLWQQRSLIGSWAVIFPLGSAALHLGYFLFLQRSYQGDLSLSYPLARGTGPLISVFGAIILLGERPSVSALVGIVLLLCGIVLLVGKPWLLLKKGNRGRAAILYALLTGVFIAGYTIWDKYMVDRVAISPFLMNGAWTLVLSGTLMPAAVKKWGQVKQTWNRYRWEVVGVAVLSPLAYIIVLFVLTFSPVSYVAPLRECSVLIGTLMGMHFLSEGRDVRRIVAAVLVLLGIILLAINV